LKESSLLPKVNAKEALMEKSLKKPSSPRKNSAGKLSEES